MLTVHALKSIPPQQPPHPCMLPNLPSPYTHTLPAWQAWRMRGPQQDGGDSRDTARDGLQRPTDTKQAPADTSNPDTNTQQGGHSRRERKASGNDRAKAREREGGMERRGTHTMCPFSCVQRHARIPTTAMDTFNAPSIQRQTFLTAPGGSRLA